MIFLAFIFLFMSILHTCEAFCVRPYDIPSWQWRNLSRRAADSDIVIYATVVDSPCEKHAVISKLNAPKVSISLNATNSSSEGEQQQPSPTMRISKKETNESDICFTRAFYSVTFKVLCVIKGGLVPKTLHLRPFGFGPGMCLNYAYNETFHAFHVFKGLKYLVFLGREKGAIHSHGFWPHTTNYQPAATEITEESMLKPIFKAAGGHAHRPLGVSANETLDVCKPYVAGAGTHHGIIVTVLLVLLSGTLLM